MAVILPVITASIKPGAIQVRIDGAGGTKETVGFLARRRVSYSVGFKLPDFRAADLLEDPQERLDPGPQRRRRPPPGGGRGRDPPTCWT